MELNTDIHVTLKLNCNQYADPLTFWSLRAIIREIFQFVQNFITKYLQNWRN